jgi:hypothetical protein
MIGLNAVVTAWPGRWIYQRVVSACDHYITADMRLVVSCTITALVVLSMPYDFSSALLAW